MLLIKIATITMLFVFKYYHTGVLIEDSRGNMVVVLQSLKVSHLSIIPSRFHELPTLNNWMCELCTFSQIQSQLNISEEIKCYNSTVPSSPPQSIIVTSTDPASLRVSWQSPMDNYNVPITGYVIRYRKNAAQDTIEVIKNISGTTHTISGLVACTKYSVMIAAINGDRTGPFSEPVVEISGEDSELNLYVSCKNEFTYVYYS